MTGEQFITVLISLLGVVAAVSGFLFWRMFTRMEGKIDSWFKQHLECRERQMTEMVHRPEFDEWKKGRPDIWRRLHGHTHTESGKVVVNE